MNARLSSPHAIIVNSSGKKGSESEESDSGQSQVDLSKDDEENKNPKADQQM